MVSVQKITQNPTRRGLIVGSYCHDVFFRDGVPVAQSLGGAASFISAVLDALSIPFNSVSKVGPDFAYSTHHNPIIIPTSKTTLFHAYFFDPENSDGDGHRDRILKRVTACDHITPSDLPDARFNFGMAVGVGGEILPETLEKMLEICDLVFADIQAMIRVFDKSDGTVNLVELKDSGFFHLLPRIGFLKASAEEAQLMDVEEVRKLCCVVVTHGKDGCKVHWDHGEVHVLPFSTNQIDPTGAGDSFLGAFAAGINQGLTVPDSALLGNLFGSLAVAHIGLPKLDSMLLQRVKDEVQRRMMQGTISCRERRAVDQLMMFSQPLGHKQFHELLGAAKVGLTFPSHHERQLDQPVNHPKPVEQQPILCHYTEQQHTNLLGNSIEASRDTRL